MPHVVAHMPKKRETRAEHFARNAAAGRTGRFNVKLDMRHIPDADRKKFGMPAVEISITNGTLTPEQASRLWAVINEAK